jgi:hypothetical protein
MPGGQPSMTDLHVDALLSMLSIAYMNEPDAFIADQLFPMVNVAKQSNKIASYNKDYWFRDEAGIRAPGAETKGGGHEVTTSTTYFCDNYGWHEDVADEERKNYDQPFDPDADATALVVEKLKLRRECAWAADFFKTGVWGTSYDITVSSTAWTDWANSDPIANVETAREAVYSNTAREPNKLVLGRNVWRYVKHHPDFLERIKYTQKAILTAELVAAILEVDKVFIGKSIYATTKEGQATQTLGYIFGNHALLMYTPQAARLRTPTAGYTIVWNVFGGISYVRRVRDDKGQYDRIEGHTFFDQKILGTDCGYIMLNAV